jgi:hypothetical protein
MALTPGTRLGAYTIGAPLGIGGPAYARAVARRELRRGLAVAKEART